MPSLLSDRTATKNRNEDFLKELDKDRTGKGCEYAVLSNDKVQDVTIKKLTRGNPTMADKFARLKHQDPSDAG